MQIDLIQLIKEGFINEEDTIKTLIEKLKNSPIDETDKPQRKAKLNAII